MHCLSFDLDPRNLAGKRVLVFEDEFFLTEILSNTLRKSGAIVLYPAADPRAALLLITDGKVDAAVIDVGLGVAAFLPVVMALRARKLQLAFVGGHDDWFLPEEEEFDPPARREAADLAKVVHLLSAAKRS